MMNEDFKVVCKCGEEYPQDHSGLCLKCGETGQYHKAYKKRSSVVVGVSVGSGNVGIKGALSATHKQKWSGESLTIFFGVFAVILTLVSFGIFNLLPFIPAVNFLILVSVTIIMCMVFWWQRYIILQLIRKLENKFGGEKKF
jgi:hypothetical protein